MFVFNSHPNTISVLSVKEKVCYLRSLDYFTESILSLDVTKLNIKAYNFRAKSLPGPFYQRVLLSLVIL